ncbi:MAG TPA: phosphatidate cytidylyltransferase [bacterium]|mgnify:CR=1 FL=1|nr:phosphatidate cytidylyltransferase [bacterium]
MEPKKIIVALVLLPALIWLIGWAPLWMLLVVMLVLGAGLGGWESAQIAFGSDETYYKLLATVFSIVMALTAATADATNICLGLVGVFLVTFLLTGLFSADLSQVLPRTAKVMFVAIYPGLLAGYLVALKNLEIYADDAKLLMFLFALVWINDSGAYFAGKSLGKHKMSPRLSPNKTWEGAIGGFAATVVLGVLIGAFSGAFTVLEGFILGVILGVVGPLGDLMESAIKRGANIKDSGTLLPGHGGVLDRIDSVLVCAPILYYYIVLRGAQQFLSLVG